MSRLSDKPHERCGHGRNCCSIYGRLGRAEGPSVTVSVLIAFGIPIVVFIVSLATAGALLGGFRGELVWPTVLAFVIALALTVAVVLVIWRTTQRPVERAERHGPS